MRRKKIVMLLICSTLLILGCANPALEHLELGDTYSEQEQWDEAIMEYNQAIELDPELAEAYNNRGAAYNEKKQWDLAITDLNKAIELDPEEAMAYNNRGNAYNGKEQWDLALADLNKAIELDPEEAMAYNNRGVAYNGKEQWDLAIADLNRAVGLEPELAEAYSNRGFAYCGVKQWDLAIADLDRAIELDPEEAIAYNKVWLHQFGSGSDDIPHCIALDILGNVYIAGMTDGSLSGQTSKGSDDAFISKYDSSGNELWTRQFGTSCIDSAEDIAVDKLGNIYIVGSTYDISSNQSCVGYTDAFIHKYDSSGNQLWTRVFGTESDEHAYGVAVAGSDSIYIIGDTYRTQPGQHSSAGYDAFICKYDSSGNELWMQVFGDTNRDVPQSITVDRDGNAYIAGQMGGDVSSGYNDTFVCKYDGSGNQLWIHRFGADFDNSATDIAHDGLGSIYLVGYASGNLSDSTPSQDCNAFLRKYDESGDELWTCQFGGDGVDWALGVAVDGLRNAYIVGFTNGTLLGQTSIGDVDAFLLKYSRSGDQLWAHQFGTGSGDSASGVATEISESVYHIYVVGRTYGTFPEQTHIGAADVFILKMKEKKDKRQEAQIAKEELSSVQEAVKAIMRHHNLSTLPNPVTEATNNMSAFPDATSVAGTADKLRDPAGNVYVLGADKNGYVIYQHDFVADATKTALIDYFRSQYTDYYYVVDSQGTVTQLDMVPPTPKPPLTPDETEAAATELSNIQSAVIAMMVDNELSTLPNPVTSATSNMANFPDDTSAVTVDKVNDPNGTAYQAGDADGFILYQHDIIADNAVTGLVNYVATATTKGTYTIDASGTVTQVTTGYE